VTTLDLARRTNDFGVAQYFPSHEPWVVPEPMTLEPAETVSRADLDTYAEIIRLVAQEAYDDPETVRTSPHSSSVHYLDPEPMDDPARWAMTWRAWRRKHG
jgi:glycine dehydrogenase subunit 2